MIAPLLDETLGQNERHAALKERLCRPITWPNGEEKPIHKSTLYRWHNDYEKKGFEGLLPKERQDRGKPRQDRQRWIDHAIHLLLEEPLRSLSFLLMQLVLKFSKCRISRATLHRELKRHPLYPAIDRQKRREKRLRRRFEANAPHAIWHLDAKGPFTVVFKNGKKSRVVVLTILDDFSRAVLGVTIADAEDLGAAVRLFRQVAARWGLPNKIYCDRHSVYDSLTFRTALATLGVHRIRTKPRNAPAHGKIEAYHRWLQAWFVNELKHQVVIDLDHLKELLEATIDLLYQNHFHRSIRQTPAERLAGECSKRQVSLDDLLRVFWIYKRLKAHAKSGEIHIKGLLFRVPREYAGKRVSLRYDPADPRRVHLLGEKRKEILLRPALEPEPKPPQTTAAPARGAGALQRLLDHWRGRALPQAEAGFGLPEVFTSLSDALARAVPETESEAILIQDFYRRHGPFERAAFAAALKKALKALGPGRPLSVLVDGLKRLIVPTPKPKKGGSL
jgi:transposase InsO family protein